MNPRITRIRVRRLVSGPDYSNRAIEAEAEVGEAAPDRVLRMTEDWIAAQLACPDMVRGFTPHDAEMMADDARDLEMLVKRHAARLREMLGEHECAPYLYHGIGWRCRFCNEPMVAPTGTSADPSASPAEQPDDLSF